jgi:amino acid permease
MQEIYLSELGMLAVAVFAPPLMIAVPVALWVLKNAKSLSLLSGFLAIVLTSTLSVFLAYIVMKIKPESLNNWHLGIIDLAALNYFPVMPLAFLTVAMSAPVVVFALIRWRRK